MDKQFESDLFYELQLCVWSVDYWNIAFFFYILPVENIPMF